jgi:hypothetical protein
LSALILDGDRADALMPAPLTEQMTESWLQRLLFDHPALVPLDRIEAGAGPFLPLVRELPLPRQGGAVYLDLFGVTPAGRPVLVECKLWRNPQARREVVAQILEYAALLRNWTLADLSAHLARPLGGGANPVFAAAAAQAPGLDEATFTDALARALRTGDFLLVIAGDGIREDAQAIAEHLAGSRARLGLLEIRIWQDAAGRRVVVPQVPLKTEVLRLRVVTDAEGAPLPLAEDAEAGAAGGEAAPPDPARAARRAENRAFWQAFIDGMQFSHPDQPPPRHGGNNWVRIPLPPPARWLTVYRMSNVQQAGLWLLPGEGAAALFAALDSDLDAIRAETGLDALRTRETPEAPPTMLAVRAPPEAFASDAALSAWLADAADRLVTALRPRLAALGAGG